MPGFLPSRCARTFVFAAFFVGIAASTANAQTTVWNGGTGNWNTAGNWSNGLPSSTRDARIDNLPGTTSIVSLSANGAAKNLTVDANDELDLAGRSLSLAGTLVSNNGVIHASGPISFSSSGTLSGTGSINSTHVMTATSVTNSAGHTLNLNAGGESGPYGLVLAQSITNNGDIVCGFLSQSELLADTITNTGTIISIGALLSLRAPEIVHSGSIQTIDSSSVININVDGYAGGVTITGAGSWDITDGGLFAPNPVAIHTTGEFHVGGFGVAALAFGSTLHASVLSGEGAISSGGYTLTILDGDPEKPFSGSLGTSAQLIKTGAGTQVINSEQTYAGGTKVQGGTLEINNPNEGGSGVGFGDLNIENGGTLAGNGSSGAFSFVKDGGALAPGSNGPGKLTFFGLTLEAGSILDLELADAPSSDLVRAYGADFVADGVDVKIADVGMQVGVTTWFIDWTGATTPTLITPSDFTLVGSPGLAGSFVVDVPNSRVGFLPTSLPVQGDYNGNGVVDAADYVVWQKFRNQSVAEGAFGDGTGNGFVDEDDYAVWITNFGNTGMGGAGGGGQVPEPSMGLLLSLGLAAGLRITRCRWLF